MLMNQLTMLLLRSRKAFDEVFHEKINPHDAVVTHEGAKIFYQKYFNGAELCLRTNKNVLSKIF